MKKSITGNLNSVRTNNSKFNLTKKFPITFKNPKQDLDRKLISKINFNAPLKGFPNSNIYEKSVSLNSGNKPKRSFQQKNTLFKKSIKKKENISTTQNIIKIWNYLETMKKIPKKNLTINENSRNVKSSKESRSNNQKQSSNPTLNSERNESALKKPEFNTSSRVISQNRIFNKGQSVNKNYQNKNITFNGNITLSKKITLTSSNSISNRHFQNNQNKMINLNENPDDNVDKLLNGFNYNGSYNVSKKKVNKPNNTNKFHNNHSLYDKVVIPSGKKEKNKTEKIKEKSKEKNNGNKIFNSIHIQFCKPILNPKNIKDSNSKFISNLKNLSIKIYDNSQNNIVNNTQPFENPNTKTQSQSQYILTDNNTIKHNNLPHSNNNNNLNEMKKINSMRNNPVVNPVEDQNKKTIKPKEKQNISRNNTHQLKQQVQKCYKNMEIDLTDDIENNNNNSDKSKSKGENEENHIEMDLNFEESNIDNEYDKGIDEDIKINVEELAARRDLEETERHERSESDNDSESSSSGALTYDQVKDIIINFEDRMKAESNNDYLFHKNDYEKYTAENRVLISNIFGLNDIITQDNNMDTIENMHTIEKITITDPNGNYSPSTKGSSKIKNNYVNLIKV